jgi:hypothetical protein
MKGFIKGIGKAEGARFNYNGLNYLVGSILWDDSGYYLFQIYVERGETYFIRFYRDKMMWYRDGDYIDDFMLALTDYETPFSFVRSLQSQLKYIKKAFVAT